MASTPSRTRSLAAKWVKQLLHHTGFTFRHARRIRANFIVVFHVVPSQESGRFEGVVRFLAENFHIVRFDELASRIQSGNSGQKPGVVALTFDDGLLNHAEVVYPILKRLGVPATFYVCSDLIDRPGSIWTYELHSRLKRLDEAVQKRFFEMVGGSGALEEIIEWMKTIPVDRREQIEKDIHRCTPGFQFTPLERERFALMNWQLIRSLDPNLITIGSHTATHIDLPQASPERLERELSCSKEILESRLNRKVEHFSYPNGNLSRQVLPKVKKYYSTAVTAVPGIVKPGDNPLLLKRICPELDAYRLSWELASYAFREG